MHLLLVLMASNNFKKEGIEIMSVDCKKVNQKHF